MSKEEDSPEGHSSEDPSHARRRRIHLRQKRQRDDDAVSADATPSLDGARKKPSIRGIKKQARYEPGVAMTKEELTAWRKEARRVRNRESAAASRKKTRDRIGELELEVGALKNKYAAALRQIVEMQSSSSNRSFIPDVLRQDLKELAGAQNKTVTPANSAPSSPALNPKEDVSGQLSPREALELNNTVAFHHEKVVNKKYQHIMNMISRPTAAKISCADSACETTHFDDPPVSFITTTPSVDSSDVTASDTSVEGQVTCHGDSVTSVERNGAGGSEEVHLEEVDESDLHDFLAVAFDDPPVVAPSDFDPTITDLADLCA